MSDCCASPTASTPHPHRHRCPRSGAECAEAPIRTIAHHIQQPWAWQHKEQRYFFCADSDCDVVYFGEDDSVILKSQLRTVVGIKEAAADALLCYCFGVSKAAAMLDPDARDYVVAQTKRGWCSCEASNPSGRCCLKDFPRGTGPG